MAKAEEWFSLVFHNGGQTMEDKISDFGFKNEFFMLKMKF